MYLLVRDELHEQFDATLVAKANALSQLVEYDEADGLETDIARDRPAGEAFELWDSKGASVLRSTSLGERHLQRLPSAAAVSVGDATLPDGTKGRVAQLVFSPRQERDEQKVHAEQPMVTLAVASSTAGLDASVARIRLIVTAVALVASLACIGLLAWLVTLGLRPVRAVAAKIGAIDAERLGVQTFDGAGVPAELRPITERLDDVVRRLERAFTRERELTGEVAHELRTPLTGLRSTIEVALGRERTPERYREVLTDCMAIVLQSERTLEALLSLARLDANMVEPRPEPVAVDELVRAAVVAVTPRATERGLTLETVLASITSRVDREQLRIVVDNLLDKAIAYAGGGTVLVELAGSTLTIANANSTLAPEHAARVFERFWRSDPARATGVHAGLGLALCKKLVDLAGGTIAVTVRDGQFLVTVALPESLGGELSRR